MKEFNDITEAADLLADIYLELKEINEGSKEYLDEFIKESDFTCINDYDKCISSTVDLYEARIYDLALYKLTNRLINDIEKIGQ